MFPLIRPGDLLTVAPVTALRRGDVLLSQRDDGKWVCHRLIRSTADSVSLRGDALSSVDRPVPRDAVLGRVIAIERDGRVRRLDGPAGRLIGILVRISVAGRPLWPRLLRSLQRLRASTRRS